MVNTRQVTITGYCDLDTQTTYYDSFKQLFDTTFLFLYMHHKTPPSTFDEYGFVLHHKIIPFLLLFSTFVIASLLALFPSTMVDPGWRRESTGFEQFFSSTLCGILSNDLYFFPSAGNYTLEL